MNDPPIRVGDLVHARWTTPKGTRKKVLGVVREIKGERVRLRCERSSMSTRSFSVGVYEIWRPLSQVKRTVLLEGESMPGALCDALCNAARESYVAHAEEPFEVRAERELDRTMERAKRAAGIKDPS